MLTIGGRGGTRAFPRLVPFGSMSHVPINYEQATNNPFQVKVVIHISHSY